MPHPGLPHHWAIPGQAVASSEQDDRQSTRERHDRSSRFHTQPASCEAATPHRGLQHRCQGASHPGPRRPDRDERQRPPRNDRQSTRKTTQPIQPANCRARNTSSRILAEQRGVQSPTPLPASHPISPATRHSR